MTLRLVRAGVDEPDVPPGERDGPDDAALMRRVCADGDDDAFRALYERHAPAVRRYCASLVGNGDAADLTQETFVHVWRARHTFRNDGAPLLAFILRIARNLSLNQLRWRRVRSLFAARAALAAEPTLHAVPSSSSSSSSLHEQRARLTRALATLSAADRDIIGLRTAEGLSYADISTILGIREDAARARLARALARLQRAWSAT